MFTHSAWRHNALLVSLSILPIYSLCYLLITWHKWRKKYILHKLHYERHNCVVMYANGRITGWPTNRNSNLKSPYEPLIYFLSTASNSLAIATMLISVLEITETLISAHKKGVHIRIILDYNYNNKEVSKVLEAAGISLIYYIASSTSSIFHHKYILKDYANATGAVCTGSLNWTQTGFNSNYENMVFTTNSIVVNEVHSAFEQDWEYVSNMYQSNPYVKAKLKGVI